MDKKDIIEFFDRLAPEWDTNMIRDDEKINAILDYAEITKGMSVLDVACGTGVLFPVYLARNVKKLTGVDISPAMIKIASSNFSDPRVELINADIEAIALPERYDRCIVYNALPHFPSPARLIEHLAGMLVPSGRLTVAHGMSRAQVDNHHSSAVVRVSVGLMKESELISLFGPFFNVDIAVSNDKMYIVSGTRK